MTLGINEIAKSTGNFVAGNVAGVVTATKMLTTKRPKHLLKMTCIQLRHPSPNTDKYVSLMSDFSNSHVSSQIKKSYTQNGAPKSGEFLTQTLKEFTQKIVKFITGNK